MSRYRYNRVSDTLRLLRATFLDNGADPFIMTNPRAIGARSTLFHWDTLRDVSVNNVAGFESYPPYISSQPLLMERLPEKYGRDAFKHLMSIKTERIGIITQLLTASGIDVRPEESFWLDVERWVYQLIEASDQTAGRLSNSPTEQEVTSCRGEHFAQPIWHSLAVDLSLLMASQVQSTSPKMNWVFWADSGVSDAGRFGRSPWFMDDSALPLMPDSQPERFLLVSMVRSAIHTTLSWKLLHRSDGECDSLAKLFHSVVQVADKG